MFIFQAPETTLHPVFKMTMIVIFFIAVACIVIKYTFQYIEQEYATSRNKPMFLNFIIFKKDLTKPQTQILEQQFLFYSNLNKKQQSIFRHRVATFIKTKRFVFREGLQASDKIVVLISATAVMLTFGFRAYCIPLINTILIYPKAFYSKINEELHKGEMNPMLGIVALSWEDFVKGFNIGNDNLNLSVHEFGHAIHANSFKNNDVSSLIFRDGFDDLKTYLRSNEIIRKRLIESHYFRAYAYTNEFEFMAVIIECFIETPLEFASKFPKLYNYTKQMLNFNFANY